MINKEVAMDKFKHDAEYLLKRAEELRTLADDMSSLDARRMLIECADGYERLAHLAEIRARVIDESLPLKDRA